MSDTVHRGRGRPPKTTAALFAEPFEFSIHPDAMGWLIAVKLPKVPVGAFEWLIDTVWIVLAARDWFVDEAKLAEEEDE